MWIICVLTNGLILSGLKGKLFGGVKVRRARSFSGQEKHKPIPVKGTQEGKWNLELIFLFKISPKSWRLGYSGMDSDTCMSVNLSLLSTAPVFCLLLFCLVFFNKLDVFFASIITYTKKSWDVLFLKWCIILNPAVSGVHPWKKNLSQSDRYFWSQTRILVLTMWWNISKEYLGVCWTKD